MLLPDYSRVFFEQSYVKEERVFFKVGFGYILVSLQKIELSNSQLQSPSTNIYCVERDEQCVW